MARYEPSRPAYPARPSLPAGYSSSYSSSYLSPPSQGRSRAPSNGFETGYLAPPRRQDSLESGTDVLTDVATDLTLPHPNSPPSRPESRGASFNDNPVAQSREFDKHAPPREVASAPLPVPGRPQPRRRSNSLSPADVEALTRAPPPPPPRQDRYHDDDEGDRYSDGDFSEASAPLPSPPAAPPATRGRPTELRRSNTLDSYASTATAGSRSRSRSRSHSRGRAPQRRDSWRSEDTASQSRSRSRSRSRNRQFSDSEGDESDDTRRGGGGGRGGRAAGRGRETDDEDESRVNGGAESDESDQGGYGRPRASTNGGGSYRSSGGLGRQDSYSSYRGGSRNDARGTSSHLELRRHHHHHEHHHEHHETGYHSSDDDDEDAYTAVSTAVTGASDESDDFPPAPSYSRGGGGARPLPSFPSGKSASSQGRTRYDPESDEETDVSAALPPPPTKRSPSPFARPPSTNDATANKRSSYSFPSSNSSWPAQHPLPQQSQPQRWDDDDLDSSVASIDEPPPRVPSRSGYRDREDYSHTAGGAGGRYDRPPSRGYYHDAPPEPAPREREWERPASRQGLSGGGYDHHRSSSRSYGGEPVGAARPPSRGAGGYLDPPVVSSYNQGRRSPQPAPPSQSRMRMDPPPSSRHGGHDRRPSAGSLPPPQQQQQQGYMQQNSIAKAPSRPSSRGPSPAPAPGPPRVPPRPMSGMMASEVLNSTTTSSTSEMRTSHLKQQQSRRPPSSNTAADEDDAPEVTDLLRLLADLQFSVALKDFHTFCGVGVQRTLVRSDGQGHAYVVVNCKFLPKHEDIHGVPHLSDYWVPLFGSRWEFRTETHKITVVFQSVKLAQAQLGRR